MMKVKYSLELCNGFFCCVEILGHFIQFVQRSHHTAAYFHIKITTQTKQFNIVVQCAIKMLRKSLIHVDNMEAKW